MSGEEKVIKVVVEKGKDDETEEDEVKRLKAELEAERTEKEDLRNKMSLIAQKQFEEKKAKLGCKDADITTPEQLIAWASGAGKKSDDVNIDPISRPSSGVLTLQGQNAGVGFLQKKYEKSPEGYREMMDDLHEKAKSEDPEVAAQSQAILDELLLKAVKNTKEGKKTAGDVPMKLDMKKYNKERAEKQNE